MIRFIAVVALLFILVASPALSQTVVTFSDQAEMSVKWTQGNAQFPTPKDYVGDFPVDFWLIEGPQNGERNGMIKVRFNFRQKAAYDKAVLDTANYTLIKKVTTVVGP